MKVERLAIIAGLLITSAFAMLIVVSSVEGVQPFFEDEFDGTAIDSTKWNAEIATTGQRWCSSTVEDHLSHTGTWLDVTTELCHDSIQSPPHGAIVVSSGLATFHANRHPIRTYPYIWSGPPTRPSPFPTTGDFILEVGMKYHEILSNGSGFRALLWQNTDPAGDNPPVPYNQEVFRVWPYEACLIGQCVSIPISLASHGYRVEYGGGQYSLLIDGTLSVGPITSNLRPNTIWIGNPVFTHWGIFYWTEFDIDYVRVTYSGPTATRLSSFMARFAPAPLLDQIAHVLAHMVPFGGVVALVLSLGFIGKWIISRCQSR